MSQETNKRVVLAGFLIVIGIVLILNNFHILPNIPWLFSWPMILILVGTFIILTTRRVLAALIIIGIGLYFLIPDIFNIYFDRFWNLWPLILIAIGMAILLRNRSSYRDSRTRTAEKQSEMDYIDEISIFSGGEKIITSQDFKGGKITSIFGGSEINLLNARLSSGTIYIDVFTLFGGSVLIVPSHWNVKVDMVAIFGGFADKRDYRSEGQDKEGPELYIKGITLFGGGEIKSHK